MSQPRSLRIGCFVEDDIHRAVVEGLLDRWCPAAELVSLMFRGNKAKCLRPDVRLALSVCFNNDLCDYVVWVTDADDRGWHRKRNEELDRCPDGWKNYILIGVPDRNVECWLALNRSAIAELCNCEQDKIPRDDPSGFIQRRLHTGERDDEGRQGREAIKEFVSHVGLKQWLDDHSFDSFYTDVRAKANEHGCSIPDEYEQQ